MRGAAQVPRGSVYKGAVHMAGASECHSMQDILTEIALDAADAGEQALFLGNM